MSTSASFKLPPLGQPVPTRRAGTGQATSDVRLFHTKDGGEIEIVRGLVTMADGLETAVYLSLFGGNERDRGLAADDRLQWWGNLDEPDESRKCRSETQALLRSLPATAANLRRIDDAVTRDLDWLKSEIASSVETTVTMPAANAIAVDVAILVKSGTKYQFQFGTSWGAQQR